ncbi:MAG: redoxin family protein [Planctomycetota bacterium]
MIPNILAFSFLLLSHFQAGQDVATFQLPSARTSAFVTSDDFAGKVVYVEVARTTCAACAAEVPALKELRAKYRDRGFEVLTVYDELPSKTGDDPFTRALADATKKKLEHPIAINDGGEFHNLFYSKIKGTPSAFVISRNGKMHALGHEPLSANSHAQTIVKIESLLSEAAEPVRPPARRAPLAPFSLLMYSGGVVRSSEFLGKPTILAAWLPGPLMVRLGPALEKLQKNYGDRVRIAAVTFSEFDTAHDAASRVCPSVPLAAPDARAHTVLDAARLPQILFLDAYGNVAKRITTLYDSSGIEASVFEKITQILIAETPANVTINANNNLLVRDETAGLEFTIPPGFAEAKTSSNARLEFTKNDARVRSRLIEGAFGQEGLDRVRSSLVTTERNYRVNSEERLQNGTILLSDEWESDAGRCRGLRVFVNTPKGIVEIQLSGPSGDFERYCNDFRSTAESVIVNR